MSLPLHPLRIGPDALALSPREPFLAAAAADAPVERGSDAVLRIEPLAARAAPTSTQGESDWSDDVSTVPRQGEAAPPGDVVKGRSRRLRVLLACVVASAAGYAAYAYVEIAHPDLWRRLSDAFAAPAPVAPAMPIVPVRQDPAPLRPSLASAPSAPPPPAQTPATVHAAGQPALPEPGAGAKAPAPAAQQGARTLEPRPASTATHDAADAAPAPATPDAAAAPAMEPASSVEPAAVVARGTTRQDDALLLEAWQALDAGRNEAARALYRRALTARPGLVAALLGEAAALTRLGQRAEAQQRYLAVLESDPENGVARGNLMLLRLDTDEGLGEDAIRALIAQRPSAFLYALLGHVRARSGRWDGAREAFQTAHHLQPDQAEHAFNLAVSLEHLGETRLALQLYRRALASGEGRAPVAFDLAQAARRIAILGDERAD